MSAGCSAAEETETSQPTAARSPMVFISSILSSGRSPEKGIHSNSRLAPAKSRWRYPDCQSPQLLKSRSPFAANLVVVEIPKASHPQEGVRAGSGASQIG